MKRRQFSILACLFVLLTYLIQVPAAAGTATYFSYSLDPVSASREGVVYLNINAYETEETAAGFRLKIQYDENVLSFISTEISGAVKSGTLQTNNSAGLVSSVYVCNTEKGYAPKLSGKIASFLFQVEPEAKEGKTSLTVSVDQICDYGGESLEAGNSDKTLDLKVVSTPSSKASLSSLQPSAGTLEPDFSPSVHSYTLNVGSDTSTLDFQTNTVSGGTVQVSRKTLNGAGKTTKITITVTSEDQTESAQYIVTVARASKESAVSSSITAGNTGGSGSDPEKKIESAEQTEQKDSGSGTGKSGNKTGTQQFVSETGQAVAVQGEPTIQEGQQETGNNRPLILVGDQMPSYLVGMLVAALCISVGIAVSLWLPIRRKP